MLPQALQLVTGQVMAQKSRLLQSRQQFKGHLLALARGLGLRLLVRRAGLDCLLQTAVKVLRVI